MMRSIAAIAMGFLLMVVLAFGAEFALLTLFHREPLNDSDREPILLAILLVTTSVCAAVGGYCAGIVAPARPLFHALVVGVLGLLGYLPLALAQWRNEPAWYHVCILALVLPAAAVGGWFCDRQQAVA